MLPLAASKQARERGCIDSGLLARRPKAGMTEILLSVDSSDDSFSSYKYSCDVTEDWSYNPTNSGPSFEDDDNIDKLILKKRNLFEYLAECAAEGNAAFRKLFETNFSSSTFVLSVKDLDKRNAFARKAIPQSRYCKIENHGGITVDRKVSGTNFTYFGEVDTNYTEIIEAKKIKIPERKSRGQCSFIKILGVTKDFALKTKHTAASTIMNGGYTSTDDKRHITVAYRKGSYGKLSPKKSLKFWCIIREFYLIQKSVFFESLVFITLCNFGV